MQKVIKKELNLVYSSIKSNCNILLAVSVCKLKKLSLKYLILKKLQNKKWSSNNIQIFEFIKNRISKTQKWIFFMDKKVLLIFLNYLIFNIENWIFSIDIIFHKWRSINYNQREYSNFIFKQHKFILLKQAQSINALKLPVCKNIIVLKTKTNNRLKSHDVSLALDWVIQRMFLNFLDAFVEKKLKCQIFPFWKGKKTQMLISTIHHKLDWIKWIEWSFLCKIRIRKFYSRLFHKCILDNYAFPKHYIFLLFRWLTPNVLYKDIQLKKCKRGLFKNFILSHNIINILFSNSIVSEKKVRLNIFSKVSSSLLLTNNLTVLYRYINILKKNLKKVGMPVLWQNINIAKCTKSNVGFEFSDFQINFSRDQRCKKLLQFYDKKIDVVLLPTKKIMKQVKRKLKETIKKLFNQSNKDLAKSFLRINRILQKWGYNYYFNKGCEYSKSLDSYVFKNLKKRLILKLRYKGLLRPKLIIQKFLGLNKSNPNNKKLQLSLVTKYKSFSKKMKRMYIWYCWDSFLRTSIDVFFFNHKILKKHYYVFQKNLKKTLNKAFCKRSQSKVENFLYRKQHFSCLVCNKELNNKYISNNVFKLKVYHLIKLNKEYEINLSLKFYESLTNKLLLHKKCYELLYANKLFWNFLIKTL